MGWPPQRDPVSIPAPQKLPQRSHGSESFSSTASHSGTLLAVWDRCGSLGPYAVTCEGRGPVVHGVEDGDPGALC